MSLIYMGLMMNSFYPKVKQVASAVAYIHATGEVHGNIIPVCPSFLLMNESDLHCGR